VWLEARKEESASFFEKKEAKKLLFTWGCGAAGTNARCK
jgi:hypothetical protein